MSKDSSVTSPDQLCVDYCLWFDRALDRLEENQARDLELLEERQTRAMELFREAQARSMESLKEKRLRETQELKQAQIIQHLFETHREKILSEKTVERQSSAVETSGKTQRSEDSFTAAHGSAAVSVQPAAVPECEGLNTQPLIEVLSAFVHFKTCLRENLPEELAKRAEKPIGEMHAQLNRLVSEAIKRELGMNAKELHTACDQDRNRDSKPVHGMDDIDTDSSDEEEEEESDSSYEASESESSREEEESDSSYEASESESSREEEESESSSNNDEEEGISFDESGSDSDGDSSAGSGDVRESSGTEDPEWVIV